MSRGSRASVAFAFACLVGGQAGCASQLDFDAVSAGSHAGQGGSNSFDAAQRQRADDAGQYDQMLSAAVAQGSPGSLGTSNKPSQPGAAASAANSGSAALTDASTMDAGAMDASTTDAGAMGANAAAAAGSDAGVPQSPPRTSLCGSVKPVPALCDDFEGDASLSMWSGAIIKPKSPTLAGAVGVDARAARSGSASLLAVVDPAVPHCEGCDLSVCMRASFYELQGHNQLTIEFDMRIEQIDQNVGRHSTLLHFYMGSPERGFSQHMLQLESAGEQAKIAFVEYDTDGQVAGSTPEAVEHNHGFMLGPKLQEWVHVKYALDAVDADGSGNTLRVTVGDSVLADGPLYYGLRYREPELELGVPFVYTSELDAEDSNEVWQVRYDNVLVVIEPRT